MGISELSPIRFGGMSRPAGKAAASMELRRIAMDALRENGTNISAVRFDVQIDGREILLAMQNLPIVFEALAVVNEAVQDSEHFDAETGTFMGYVFDFAAEGVPRPKAQPAKNPRGLDVEC